MITTPAAPIIFERLDIFDLIKPDDSLLFDIDGVLFDFYLAYMEQAVGQTPEDVFGPGKWRFYLDHGHTDDELNEWMDKLDYTTGYHSPYLHLMTRLFCRQPPMTDRPVLYEPPVRYFHTARSNLLTDQTIEWLTNEMGAHDANVRFHQAPANKVVNALELGAFGRTFVFEDKPDTVALLAEAFRDLPNIDVVMPVFNYNDPACNNGPCTDAPYYITEPSGTYRVTVYVATPLTMLDDEEPEADVQADEPLIAERHNEGKVAYDNLWHFPHALEGWARHCEAGRAKYPDTEDGTPNWKLGGKPIEEYLNSFIRHMFAMLRGEVYDPETRTRHSSAMVWNAAALDELHFAEYPANMVTFEVGGPSHGICRAQVAPLEEGDTTSAVVEFNVCTSQDQADSCEGLWSDDDVDPPVEYFREVDVREEGYPAPVLEEEEEKDLVVF